MKWDGPIAFTMTVVVAIILLLITLKPYILREDLSVEGAKTLGLLLGALIAMIASYLGKEK